MADEKKNIRVSVRNLVEFVLRSGDLDNRHSSSAEKDAMQAGNRIHRKIQRQMGSDYRAEVSMKHTVEEEQFQIVIEGRADGVIETAAGATIDEIKGIYRDLNTLEEPVPVHMAQAMCYGYFYCTDHNKNTIGIQLTYCNLETEEIRRFRQDKSFDELDLWFQGLIHEYVKWARYLYHHELRRNESLKELVFPYEYRAGQKELAISVYRAMAQGRNLFIQAPTGIGKTLSAVFPALKAMGEGYGEKLFYLTAKTITRSVAEETFALLRDGGLFFSAVTITAKEKLCPMEKTECNPDACHYAKGHFDRINDAIYDMICEEHSITRDVLLSYANRYQVCPFEFCLDISNWVDGIICDYNYVFDPNVRLKRYFSEKNTGEYLLLMDEAHNLISRAREVYSAVLYKEDFLTVKQIVKNRSAKVAKGLERCNKNLLEMKRECEGFNPLEDVNLFVSNLMRLFGDMEVFMDEEKEYPDRDIVLDFYFQIRHFLNMYEGVGDHYQIYTELQYDGRFVLRLFCIDPSKCMEDSLEKGRSCIFFSATLLPILYYKKLLSGNEEDYAVYAHSPFDEENRMLLIASDVSSRYTRRNRNEYLKVVDYIKAMAASHRGNYMVFFPSYQYMETVEQLLDEAYDGTFSWQMQSSHMSEHEREDFLALFEQERTDSFVGLCVLGGIFSEGIDLKAERLEGVIIVGTGLPMLCTEQEILKQFFDNRQENGFQYAYQYPGMNKVMQAAGRVIRTMEDRGIILLLDERFLKPDYQELFPREWSQYGIVTRRNVTGWLEQFWNK
ncbi:MAG: ATP-dependent DNA helicase [Lachnospiraceae bacterium]